MTALESTIADTLVAILDTDVAALNYIAFDRVRLSIDEFQPHEIPAVQIYDIGQDIAHVRGQKEVEWALALELIMKTTVAGVVDQKALWNLRRDIEIALWNNPNLNISKVIHLLYTGNVTDLHLLEPYYIARMDLTVKFRDDLTGSC